ncbi:MAG: YggN family protein [Coriobacteriales bacterium]|jgi:hypothetical protein|nr:YggN family protein [Coriobacteriales bacterium]
MGCRCSDIARCESAYRTLTSSVKASIDDVKTYNSKVSPALAQAATDFADSLYQGSVAGVALDMELVNQALDEQAHGLLGEYNSAQDSISSKLSALRQEDKAYHTELARQREAQRQQQQQQQQRQSL